MIQKKTYYKKESKIVWMLLLALIIGLIIFGYVLARYIVWQVIPLVFMAIAKVISISKKPENPIIELDDKGMTIFNSVTGDKIYNYTDISIIKMNSKALNGYIKLKSTNKKVRIDSVAIDLIDQQEIVSNVNARITL